MTDNLDKKYFDHFEPLRFKAMRKRKSKAQKGSMNTNPKEIRGY